MRGRWFITPHAVRRYIERIDRCAGYEEALAVLIETSTRAHLVHRRPDGVELWRLGRPRKWRFHVAPGRVADLPQLLTVMPACEHGRLDSHIRRDHHGKG